MSEPVPIAYARTYTQFGVTVDADGQALRIVLPHPEEQHRALLVGGAIIVGTALVYIPRF